MSDFSDQTVDYDTHGPDVNRTLLFNGEDLLDFGAEEEAEFGGIFGDIGKFVGNAVKTAGKEMGKVGKNIQQAGGAIGKAIKKIPVVGAPVRAVLDAGYHSITAPINLTVDIAKGKRVDKAFMARANEMVKDVKTVAPYAKSVISMVPGIGTGVAAGLGAGLALAEGQPITKALMEGVFSAVPGGAVAKQAAIVAATGVEAAVRGKKFDTSVITIPGIPPEAQKALAIGIKTTADIASGKNVGKAATEAAEKALNEGMKYMTPEAKKAFQTGLALQTGRMMQVAKSKALPVAQNKFIQSGIEIAKTVPTVNEARKLAKSGIKGFDLGQGLMQQRAGVFDVVASRAKLKNPADKKGFDMALATRIGLVTHAPKPKLSQAALAGRAITNGMRGMVKKENKMAIMKDVVKNPSAAVGAKYAITKLTTKEREPWLVRLVNNIKSLFN